MMPTLSQSASHSSMEWLVRMTACSRRLRITSHMKRLVSTSIPVLGSSRSTTGGSPTSAIATLSLRLLPPE